MTYPISVEQYIAAMQAQFGSNAQAEDICRNYYLPAMNNAYQDGKAGEPGYPMDPVAEITAFEKVQGHPVSDWGKRFIAAFVHSLNAAYTQGQQTAKEAAV